MSPLPIIDNHTTPDPQGQATHGYLPQAWLDGRLCAVASAGLSFLDRGFLLADGLFETLLVKNGRPLRLADHGARLAAGARLLHLPPPDMAAITNGFDSLWQANNCQADRSYILRITYSRGVGSGRGLVPSLGDSKPTLLLLLAPYSPRPPQVAAIIAQSTRKNHHSPLANIKWLGGYGDNILAKQEAMAKGAAEALLLNGDGKLVGATTANVFLYMPDGRWLTPPLTSGALAGTVRAAIIAQGLLPHLVEQDSDSNSLVQAVGGFICNSLGLTCLTKVAERHYRASLTEIIAGLEKCLYC